MGVGGPSNDRRFAALPSPRASRYSAKEGSRGNKVIMGGPLGHTDQGVRIAGSWTLPNGGGGRTVPPQVHTHRLGLTGVPVVEGGGTIALTGVSLTAT
eukprot:751204-Hanusia_phi.AAC.1